MERRFKREIGALGEVFAFIDGFLSSNSADERASFALRLAAEELFTNFVRHNRKSDERIAIELRRDADRLIMQLRDFDVDPFDPAERENVDIQTPLSERQVGGLGIHLVQNMVDHLTYEYEDRTMCVMVVKRMEESDV